MLLSVVAYMVGGGCDVSVSVRFDTHEGHVWLQRAHVTLPDVPSSERELLRRVAGVLQEAARARP